MELRNTFSFSNQWKNQKKNPKNLNMLKYRTRWIYNIFYLLYAIHTDIYTIHADIYANDADIYANHADIYKIHADMYVAYSLVMLSTIYIIHASNISYLFLCWPSPASPVSLISPVYK